MIRFALTCGASAHEFEGWFRDNAAFERQAEAGQVGCPVCGDTAVRKAIMAPAVVAKSRDADAAKRAQARLMAVMHVARQVREHVEKTHENVGERFPEEARKIHHGEAPKREIWGKATLAEARELHEEGVPVMPLPELPELDG
jgi:hypothetical protein